MVRHTRRLLCAKRYKTQLCRTFATQGTCPYGDQCLFAHGDHEMRTAADNIRDFCGPKSVTDPRPPPSASRTTAGQPLAIPHRGIGTDQTHSSLRSSGNNSTPSTPSILEFAPQLCNKAPSRRSSSVRALAPKRDPYRMPVKVVPYVSRTPSPFARSIAPLGTTLMWCTNRCQY